MPTPGPIDQTTEGNIKSRKDFKKTPEGLYKRWLTELSASEKVIRPYWTQADKIVSRLVDKRGIQRPQTMAYKVNLFASNTATQRAMLYGNEPEADVNRRFADADDQEGRVAAEMLERSLNTDMAYDSDTYKYALGLVLDDALTVGFSNARVVYEAEFEKVPGQPAMMGKHPITGADVELAPEVPESEQKTGEECDCNYVNWRDQLWSISRTWHEVRWWSFLAYMSRDQVKERFGAECAKNLQYTKSKKDGAWRTEDAMAHDPWERAEVWEIWSKEDKKVYWFSKGYSKILDEEDDPYQLDGFWPFPRPIMRNTTTSSFMPTPDFVLNQDLYDEFDIVSVRIKQLVKAMKVVGLYNASAGKHIPRLLTETFDLDLLPVEQWAMFAEKGGIKDNIEFLPLEDIAKCLNQLMQYRERLKLLLDEVTGMGDVLRGASSMVGNGPATATEQSIKSKFASVRMQALQDEFARFASDLQRLKAEIICKHYSPDTIRNQTNIAKTFDAKIPGGIEAGMALLKSDFVNFRISIDSDKIAMTDFAKIKNERVQYVQALSQLIMASTPLFGQMPQMVPYILQTLKWVMASFEGATEIEGITEMAIMAAEQAAQNPPPQQNDPMKDPKVIAQQMKAQADMQKSQMDAQTNMQKILAEGNVDQQRILSEANAAIALENAKHQTQIMHDQAKNAAELRADMTLSTQNFHQDVALASHQAAIAPKPVNGPKK